jgi:hypothetical protein
VGKVSERRTVTEQLDAARNGQEFTDALQGLFGALEKARDEEEAEE